METIHKNGEKGSNKRDRNVEHNHEIEIEIEKQRCLPKIHD